MGYGNRGMALEAVLNASNNAYRARGMAVVNKRPTPVKIVRTRGNRITDAFLEAHSTVDYEGCYRGRSLQFEAKSTKEISRFPLDNLHEHQVEHMRACIHHGAITFVILEFAKQDRTFFLPGDVIVHNWDLALAGGKKSLAYEDIARQCWMVTSARGIPLDYLQIVDKLLKEDLYDAR